MGAAILMTEWKKKTPSGCVRSKSNIPSQKQQRSYTSSSW